jgi:ATP-dependent protease HslVU (ClpYQ) peptidase subunit
MKNTVKVAPAPVEKKKMNEKQQQEDVVHYSMETAVDIELYSSRMNQNVNIKDVPINKLGPREQEEAGKQ